MSLSGVAIFMSLCTHNKKEAGEEAFYLPLSPACKESPWRLNRKLFCVYRHQVYLVDPTPPHYRHPRRVDVPPPLPSGINTPAIVHWLLDLSKSLQLDSAFRRMHSRPFAQLKGQCVKIFKS